MIRRLVCSAIRLTAHHRTPEVRARWLTDRLGQYLTPDPITPSKN